MLEQYDIKQARELVALFSVQSNLMTSEQDGSILTEATSITWTFPTVSTMLTVYGINYSIPYPNKENCQFMVCGPNEITSITPDMCVIENDTLQTITYKVDKITYVYNHILKTISITREGDINNANAIDAT
jgi:hypothetical protein